MAQNQLSCFWNEPDAGREYRSAVSLHSHTNHSKESLRFILEFTEKRPLLRWALERQSRRSTIPIDWVRAYWTPPLIPKLAFEVERNQIEKVLALAALVSLTDHDSISAPTLLRVEETSQIPLALEWSVPFEGAVFHLGVHNLPSSRAQAIVADLGAYTHHQSAVQLSELLAMLHQCPEVLLIFNHPLWDLSGMGRQRYAQVLGRFLQGNVRFLHAFELNATRSRSENNGVIELAGLWRRLLISGGDRHGCEPSGALNLTRAESFSEFVDEIRVEHRSHVLFMPQYAEPLGIRTAQAVLDVIRDCPGYSPGCRRWDDRVFHPDQSAASEQPISALWKAPPAFIERIFSVMRVMENATVRRALGQILRNEVSLELPSDGVYKAMSGRNRNRRGLRVAFFPDAYNEVDGVANTSRHFEAFAQSRGLPFLTIHAGPRNETVTAGSVTRVQLRRSPLTFPLDQTHEYDLALWGHYREVMRLVRNFDPDVVQITGPSDLGMLGALIAHKLGIPLAASWQTNVHQYARCRLSPVLSFLPKPASDRLLSAVEHWSFRAAARFYRIPRILFAPNQEMVDELERATGKPCFLMSHSVDAAVFSPRFRDRDGGPFTIGYVGRLTAEKNVRCLAQLEQSLFARGHRAFRMVVVGQGAEATWLRHNMQHAEFTGVLTGKDLSRAFANMDLFVFPSETDTFGLAVLEALSSGVPAVVTAVGGPKYTVQHGKTGYIANDFHDFVTFTELLLTQPALLSRMGSAAREHAISTSWEQIFEGMYKTYERCFYAADSVRHEILDVARV